MGNEKETQDQFVRSQPVRSELAAQSPDEKQREEGVGHLEGNQERRVSQCLAADGAHGRTPACFSRSGSKALPIASPVRRFPSGVRWPSRLIQREAPEAWSRKTGNRSRTGKPSSTAISVHRR